MPVIPALERLRQEDWETERGRWRVQGQPGIYSETLSKNK
jgi:hypothetical protein